MEIWIPFIGLFAWVVGFAFGCRAEERIHREYCDCKWCLVWRSKIAKQAIRKCWHGDKV